MPQRILIAGATLLTLGLSTRPGVRRHLRRGLHGAVRFALRLRSRPYPIQAGTVALILAPHQDDETLGCGGLVVLQRRAGVTVRVAYVTDGGASHRGHPALAPTELVTRRTAEARAAMALLGVAPDGLTFLGLPDGTLARLAPPESAAFVTRLAGFIAAVKPDDIFLPCRSDGSSEHDASFLLVTRALREAGLNPRLLEFPVWSWWNPGLLLRRLCTGRRVWRVDYRVHAPLKRQALAAYRSQVEPVSPWPRPLLSGEFLSYFSTGAEYFFEE